MEYNIPDKILLSYAKLVDTVDMYTGPFFEAGRYSNSETMQSIAWGGRIVEYGLLKIPFTLAYLGRTGDFSALLSWAPREILALSIPFGGFLQVFRPYENVTRRALRNSATKKSEYRKMK